MMVEKQRRAPMRFGKEGFNKNSVNFEFEKVHKRGEALKRSGSDLEQDLNEFKILRTVRAPMRFGKRSDRLKKAPMRFGKRAPMRFGKRNLESPSYSNEENYDYEDQMDNHFDLYSALRNAY